MSEKCRIIEPVDGIDKKLYDLCVFEYRTGFVEVGDEKICLPLKYKEIADKIENFQVRDTDVFIVSHPKAGEEIKDRYVIIYQKNNHFSTVFLSNR